MIIQIIYLKWMSDNSWWWKSDDVKILSEWEFSEKEEASNSKGDGYCVECAVIVREESDVVS